MSSIIKSVLQWIINSSTNPQALSLTIKGLLSFLIVLGVEGAVIDEATSGLVNIILLLANVITLGTAVWGFARKINITIKKHI